ncbi:TetR/AcrR family transcriptional regulator [Chloroflexota bacterium]
MNGFDRRKEQKRQSIRSSALELFTAYGFKKVSINDIAHKADVSPVTIYTHFGSKNELVREVVKTELQGMLERYREIMKGERPFPEKLKAIIFDKTKIAGQYQGEWIQAILQSDPELKRFIESFWQQEVVQLTVDFLSEGKTQGHVNLEMSQEALLLYLEIWRKGVFASADLLANIGQNVKLFSELNHLIVYGLLGKKE